MDDALPEMDRLLAKGEISLARQALVAGMDGVATLDDCYKCLSAIPVLVEIGTQGAMLAVLLQRTRAMDPVPKTDAGRAAVLELCLLLALGRFDEFNTRHDALHDLVASENERSLLAAVRRRLGSPKMEVFREQKIFGIGLSKTGTTSLSSALTMLGIDNGHYTNPLTRQLLSDLDFFMLGGATDTPVTVGFETLYYLYPNARFILTTRPIEDWVRSMKANYGLPKFARVMANMRGFTYGLLGEAIQVGLYLHRDEFDGAFHAHEQRVRVFFADKPSDRFLIFNVFEGQGWPELCAFLGKPIPEMDFPWSNRTPS
jgi:Sulfotransferase domain